MDKLFTLEQIAHCITEYWSTENLASIATLTSTISSTNTAQLADNDKEETIDYNNMSMDIGEQCSLMNDPTTSTLIFG